LAGEIGDSNPSSSNASLRTIGSKAAKPLDQVKFDLEDFCPPGSATCRARVRASEVETYLKQ
jgi:hypothetical protein